jgi:hypothetical protein
MNIRTATQLRFDMGKPRKTKLSIVDCEFPEGLRFAVLDCDRLEIVNGAWFDTLRECQTLFDDLKFPK